MFVLDLFDFFCLSSFRFSDSFDGIHRPTGGGSGLRSFVPARLFTQSEAGPSTAVRKTLRYGVSGDASNAPIVKGRGSVTTG